MINAKRTQPQDSDFIDLVKQLDEELAISDGDEHEFYNQFNKLDSIEHAVVVFKNNVPVGCGAMKPYDESTMEIKRMYTDKKYRGRGIASDVLSELERWAAELSYSRCVLETGLKQPAAIGLYHKSGYHVIPNYGQYEGVENSRCFEKILNR